MYAIKNGIISHVNGKDVQRLIDEGGYEFWDNNKNVIAENDLQDYIQKDIDAHSGTANTYEELVTQLKALGIQVKED